MHSWKEIMKKKKWETDSAKQKRSSAALENRNLFQLNLDVGAKTSLDCN